VSNSAIAPVIAGLSVGVIFIALFGSFFNDIVHAYPRVPVFGSDLSSKMLKIAKETDEVKAFLDRYPHAKTFTYTNTRIVEYFVFDHNSGKYSDLRLQVVFDENSSSSTITFDQARCLVVDTETRSIVDEKTVIEQHGKNIPNLAEFLSDERCPK
jgi:hypothetical protein